MSWPKPHKLAQQKISSRDPGRATIGFYTITEGVLTMTDGDAKAVRLKFSGERYQHKLRPDDDPHHREAAHLEHLSQQLGRRTWRIQSAAALSRFRCGLVQMITSRGEMGVQDVNRLFFCLRGGDIFTGLSNLAISARSQTSSKYWANRWLFRRRNSISRLLANILNTLKNLKNSSMQPI